jgi:hypothetical protein
MENIITLEEAIKENYWHKTIEAIIADGWVVKEGPWGNWYKDENDYDHSVTLERQITEPEGEFLVWLVSRNFGTGSHDKSTNGWFTGKIPNQPKRMRAFTFKPVNGYNMEEYIHAIGLCDYDRVYVGIQNLKPVAYANAVCEEHLAAAKRKWEQPGWTV